MLNKIINFNKIIFNVLFADTIILLNSRLQFINFLEYLYQNRNLKNFKLKF